MHKLGKHVRGSWHRKKGSTPGVFCFDGEEASFFETHLVLESHFAKVCTPHAPPCHTGLHDERQVRSSAMQMDRCTAKAARVEGKKRHCRFLREPDDGMAETKKQRPAPRDCEPPDYVPSAVILKRPRHRSFRALAHLAALALQAARPLLLPPVVGLWPHVGVESAKCVGRSWVSGLSKYVAGCLRADRRRSAPVGCESQVFCAYYVQRRGSNKRCQKYYTIIREHQHANGRQACSVLARERAETACLKTCWLHSLSPHPVDRDVEQNSEMVRGGGRVDNSDKAVVQGAAEHVSDQYFVCRIRNHIEVSLAQRQNPATQLSSFHPKPQARIPHSPLSVTRSPRRPCDACEGTVFFCYSETRRRVPKGVPTH